MDNTQEFTAIEFCAGYAGISLGLKRVIGNLRVIAYSEVEAFACANLVAKMESGLLDAAPVWTDIKTFPGHLFRGKVGVLIAGYPCQPFSHAGRRGGADDPRHLWPHILRAAIAIQPRYIFLENVEGHITLGLATVLSDLEAAGYACAWGIFSACEVSAPHQRKRVFILAELENATQPRTRSIPTGQRTEGARTAYPHGADYGMDNTMHRRCEGQNDQIPTRRNSVINAGHVANCVCSEWGQATQARHDADGTDPRWEEATGGFELQRAAGDGHAVACRTGLEKRRCQQCHDETQQQAIERSGEAWPAGYGYEQYNWEPPRTVVYAESTTARRLHGRDESQQPGLAKSSGPRRSRSRPTQSSMGRNPNGNSDRLDDAQLHTTTDNRVDELRLLGNGVVPATATRAFSYLWHQLEYKRGEP